MPTKYDATAVSKPDGGGENLYQAFFNLTIAGAAQVSIFTGKFVEANPRFCEMLGYSHEELLEKTVAEVTHPHDRETDAEQFFKLLRGEIPHIVLEKRYLRRDGTYFWANLSVNIMRDAAGIPLRTVSVIVDITASKAAQEELRASRERFEALTFASAQIVWTTDENGLVVEDSPTWRSFTSQTYEQWKGFGWLNALHPDDRQNAEKAWSDAVAKQTFYEVKYRVKHRDGDYRWMHARGVPLRRADNSIHAWVGMNTDIHEQKISEEKLLETQHRLELSLRGANLGVWTYNVGTGEFWADERALRMHGHEPGEVQTFEEAGAHVHPEDRLRSQAAFSQAIENRSKLQIENRILLPHGGLRWVASYAEFVQKSDSDIGFFYGLVQDITERKRAEENLRRSEAEFRTISNAAPALVWVCDASGNVTYLNERWYDYTGQTPQQAAGFGWADALHPDDVGRVLAEWERCRTKDDVYTGEARYRRRDGAYRWHSFRALPRRNANGEMENWYGVSFDVHAARVNSEKLIQSEQFSRSVLESSPDCVKIMTTDGRLVFMNKSGVCLLELEDFGQVENNRWQDFWTGDDYESAVKTIENAAAGDAMRFQGFCPTATGKPKWWDVIVTPVRNADGQVNSLLSVSRDITQIKLAERERDELLRREQTAREEAEAANRTKDEFLAMLSHELRTPLNAMSGWAQLLQTNSEDPMILRTGIEVISRNVRLQNALIEDLLEVSRIVTGMLRLETDKISLLPIVRETLEAVRPSAEQKNVQIETNFDLPDAEINGDRFRLQQIVNNLLINAVKFTSSGGRIRINLKRQGDRARLEIRDNGIGIAPNLLPHIFDRFRQADASTKRQFGGLGLGLTIVKHLVELHGGSISAASEGEGKGAAFTVELPLVSATSKEPQAAADHNSESTMQGETAGKQLSGIKILLVDDDADSLELMSLVLNSHGAIPTRAGSVAEALLLLERENFDLLISDLGMAGMDGFDLIENVRRTDAKRSKPLPAIALTGYASADDRERVFKAGFNFYVSKPVSFEQLPATIANLLNDHK